MALVARRFSTQSVITEKLFDVVKKIDSVDPTKLTPTARFSEIGLDSLDSVEAIVCLEDVLQIELTDEEALKITSIPEAVEAFSKYYKPPSA